MLETRDVHAFRTVVEAGSLTAAARVLHLTPGALSKLIRRFEEQLGQTLFDRDGRRLQPTEAGERLYTQSAVWMREHDRLLSTIERTPMRAMLRLASFEVFTTHLLAEVTRDTLSAVDLQVLELPVAEIASAVGEREVDLGITYVPFPDHRVRTDPIASFRFGIWHAAGAFTDVATSELPFAIPVTRLQLASGERLGIDCWPVGQPRRVRFRLTSLESALALVRLGRCAIFLPDFLGRLAGPGTALTRRPDPPGMAPVERTALAVRRRTDDHDSLADELVRAVTAALTPP